MNTTLTSLFIATGLLVSPLSQAALVAHYQLDGNALDSSGLGHHGTATGAPGTMTDRFGNVGGATLFDGTNDIIRIDDTPTMQPSTGMTISAWIYRDSLSTTNGNERIVTKGDGSSAGTDDGFIYFAWSGTALNMGIADQNDVFRTISASNAINAGAWQHVAAVFDLGIMRLYANGQLLAMQDYSGIFTSIPDSAFDWGIGEEADQPLPLSEYWNGGMDDIRIYDHALSNGDIENLANDVPVPTPLALFAPALLLMGAQRFRLTRLKN